MVRPKPLVPLQRYFVQMTLATLLPIITVAGVGALLLTRQEQSTFEEGLLDRVFAVRTAVDAQLNSSITTLVAIAASQNLDTQDFAAFDAEAKRLQSLQPEWLALNLASTDGQQLVNSLRPFNSQLPKLQDPASVEHILATQQATITDMVYGALTHRYDFAIRVPVLRGNEIRYVLSAVIDPESILRVLLAQHLPPEYIGVVIDRNHRFVARTLAPEFVGRQISADLSEALKKGRRGFYAGTTVDGRSVYTAHATSEFSGWSVAIAVPRSGYESVARRTLIIYLLVVGAALLIAFWLAKSRSRKVLGPIAALASGASQLADGGTAPIAWPGTTVRELAELEHGFERAREAVDRRAQVQAQLAAVASNATVGLIMTDEADRCTFMNLAAENLTGYQWDELDTVSLLAHLRTDLARNEPVNDNANPATPATQRHRGRHWLTHRDGHRYLVAYSTSRLSLPTSLRASVTEIRDITNEAVLEETRQHLLTDQMKLRREAEESNRAKDEFIALLGHELRNPIAAISNASYLLSRLESDKKALPEQIIRRQTAHLARLVDDLLNAGRVVTGKIELIKTRVSLREIVSGVLDTVSMARQSELPTIARRLEEVYVLGDATRLEQIVEIGRAHV